MAKNIDKICHVKTRWKHLEDVSLVNFVRLRGPNWEEALFTLLDRHKESLYRRCLLRLGNAHDAEDAVQETMLRAFRALARFEGRSGFRTWLFAIGNNQCHTLAQRKARERPSEFIRELIRIHESRAHNIDETFREETLQVRKTLMALPPKAKEVLGLRFFGDLSLEEIAVTLGIGLSAAKMRLHRALEQFAARYPDAV